MKFRLDELPDHVLEEVFGYLPLNKLKDLRFMNNYNNEIISVVMLQRGIITIDGDKESLVNKQELIKQKGPKIRNLNVNHVKRVIPLMKYLNNLFSLKFCYNKPTELLDLLDIKEADLGNLKKIDLWLQSNEIQADPEKEGKLIPIFEKVEDINIWTPKVTQNRFNYLLLLFNPSLVKKADIGLSQTQINLDILKDYTQLTTLNIWGIWNTNLSITKDFDFRKLKKFSFRRFTTNLDDQFYIMNKLLANSNIETFKFHPNLSFIADQGIIDCLDNNTINFNCIQRLSLPYLMLNIPSTYFPNIIKLTTFHPFNPLPSQLWKFISDRKKITTLKFFNFKLDNESSNYPSNNLTNIAEIIFKNSEILIDSLAKLLQSFENLQKIKIKGGRIYNDKFIISKYELVQEKLFIMLEDINYIDIFKSHFDCEGKVDLFCI